MRALLIIVLCSCTVVSTASASDPASWRKGGPRIRPQDVRTATLMAAGTARSATFRALVDRIEASNVFVYVSMSPLLKSSLAGRITWMTWAGDYRYLRATINTDLSSDQIIATLAHEMQHVVEVIDHPGVVDERSLVSLYKRIGRPSRATVTSGWETTAAQEAGNRVRRELVATPTTAALRVTNSDKS